MLKYTTGQRKGIIRYLLLLFVIVIVSMAFWFNTEKQMSLVLGSQYIINGKDFLTKEEEKSFTQLLASYKSALGIEAKLIFEGKETVQESTAILFIVNIQKKQATIKYPPLLNTLFSEKEQKLLDEALQNAIVSNNWKEELLYTIKDIYFLLQDIKE